MNKALVFVMGNQGFFIYACWIPIDFLQLPSFANYGTKVVLSINATQNQGIDA
jgi:hypothetical protein